MFVNDLPVSILFIFPYAAQRSCCTLHETITALIKNIHRIVTKTFFMFDQIKMVSLISLNGKGTTNVLFKQKYFIVAAQYHLFDSIFEHINLLGNYENIGRCYSFQLEKSIEQ